MPYLVKRLGSPFWIAGFDVTMPDGSVRRLKKSTKQTVRSLAMKEALRIEDVERKRAIGGSDMAASAYTTLAEAAEAAARGELSEARARELIAKLAESSTGAKLRFYTVKTWADDWLSSKQASAKPATVTRYKASTSAFLVWLGKRAESRLEAITKADVRGFRDAIKSGWRAGKKAGPERTGKTANAFARDVAMLFRSAVREGLLLASPASAMEALPETDSMEREVFTVADVSALVEAASGPEWQRLIFSAKKADPDQEAARSRDWPGVILLGFYLGPRLADCARMPWSAVNLERGSITYMPAKTARKKKKLDVPLHPRLAAFLASHDTPKGKGAPVFPSLAHVQVSGNAGLSSQFGAIMDAAGIDRMTKRESETGKGGKIVRRAQHSRSFHSLRHSLTTALADLDVPEEIRRRITGHSSAEVHQGYTHTARETLARAIGKLPEV